MGKNLIELSERILSKMDSDSVYDFFTNVLRLAAQYRQTNPECPVCIVPTTSRCNVLFKLCQKTLLNCIQVPTARRPTPWLAADLTLLKTLADTYAACVIAAPAAWSIAYCCQESKSFPHLIVVSELMFHGRTLNEFLYGLEKRLQNAELIGATMQRFTSPQMEILNKINIFVQTWLSDSSVLLPRYKKILDRDNPGTAMSLDLLRNRSIGYSQFTSLCGTNASVAVAVPSVYQTELHTPVTTSVFSEVCTKMQNLRQRTWLFFYPSSKQPRIICSVRCRKDQLQDGQCVYIPSVLVDHVQWEQLLDLHRKLIQEAQVNNLEKVSAFLNRFDFVLDSEQNINPSLIAPWLVRTTNLVLELCLLKQFLREVIRASENDILTVWRQTLDWESLVHSFRSLQEGDGAEETRAALQELWSWEPAKTLETYLSVYSIHASSIQTDWMDVRCNSIGEELGENSPLVQWLEDAISQVALAAEKNAFTLYGSGLCFSDEALSNWGENHSVSTLLEEMRTKVATYAFVLKRPNLYESVAAIIQAIDIGLIDPFDTLDRQPLHDLSLRTSSPPEVYTRLRAGETALLLLPIRYRNLLPVLSEIQEKRGMDLDGAFFDLTRFVEKIKKDDSGQPIHLTDSVCMTAEQLKHNLFNFYGMFVHGGQKFKEWQCNLHDRRLPAELQNRVGETNRKLRTHFLWVYRNL